MTKIVNFEITGHRFSILLTMPDIDHSGGRISTNIWGGYGVFLLL